MEFGNHIIGGVENVSKAHFVNLILIDNNRALFYSSIIILESNLNFVDITYAKVLLSRVARR